MHKHEWPSSMIFLLFLEADKKKLSFEEMYCQNISISSFDKLLVPRSNAFELFTFSTVALNIHCSSLKVYQNRFRIKLIGRLWTF